MERPLITFMLIAHNQEALVREAICGAFAQTYSPLEIILSDDASTDSTFRIMEEMAANYAGPHTVILNRNPHNAGIVGHVNRAMELTHGELIVVAAGDDISFPDRVTETFNLWRDNDRRPDMLYFNYEPIGEHPYPYDVEPAKHSLEYQLQKGGARLKGATAAWTKRLFDLFGPIPPGINAEDKIIPFRAALSGGIVCRDIPVIKYRLDRPERDLSGARDLAERNQELARRKSYYEGFEDDIDTLCSKVPDRRRECEQLRLRIQAEIMAIERERMLYSTRRIENVVGLLYLWSGRTWGTRSLRNRASLTRHVVVHNIFGVH
jgi:hypothetical protein